MEQKKKIKIVVPIHYKQEYKTKKDKTFMVALNWYRNAHHFQSNAVKHFYHELVAKQLDNTKFDKPVMVHYDIYLPRKGTDGGNVRSIIEKFVLDGLVVNNVLEDDDFEKVVGDTAMYYLDKKNPRAEITIYEYE